MALLLRSDLPGRFVADGRERILRRQVGRQHGEQHEEHDERQSHHRAALSCDKYAPGPHASTAARAR